MDCPVDSLSLITMLGRNAALLLCALGDTGKIQKQEKHWERYRNKKSILNVQKGRNAK